MIFFTSDVLGFYKNVEDIWQQKTRSQHFKVECGTTPPKVFSPVQKVSKYPGFKNIYEPRISIEFFTSIFYLY